MSDICFKDAEGFELAVDSYPTTYSFMFTTYDTEYRQLAVGLSRDQALNLAKFLIGELSK